MDQPRYYGVKRLGAMFFDYTITVSVALMLLMPDAGSYQRLAHLGQPAHFASVQGPILYLLILVFAIMFCKDSFDGRSVAKRAFDQQVVRTKTGIAAGPLRCLVRNLTIVIYPIEAIIVLVHPSQRLGDMIAGTKVTPYIAKETTPVPPKWGQILLSLILAYGIAASCIVPLVDMVHRAKAQNPELFPTSMRIERVNTAEWFATSG